MGKRATPTRRPAPRLYLATPPLAEARALPRDLADLIKAADIAAALLRIAPAADAAHIVTALAPVVQKAGAALLLDGHIEIAARSQADGVHVSDPAALKSALAAFKPGRIVGAGHLPSRHDAMVAAEAGADYVLFGEIDKTGKRPSADAIVEHLSWWADLFEVPCAAYAATRDEARAFASAGADFVLVDDLIWGDARGARAALMDAAAAISQNGD